MTNLAEHNGLTRCKFTTWKEQEECSHSIKSKYRDACIWMRLDGTCSEPTVCAEKVNN